MNRSNSNHPPDQPRGDNSWWQHNDDGSPDWEDGELRDQGHERDHYPRDPNLHLNTMVEIVELEEIQVWNVLVVVHPRPNTIMAPQVEIMEILETVKILETIEDLDIVADLKIVAGLEIVADLEIVEGLEVEDDPQAWSVLVVIHISTHTATTAISAMGTKK